MGELEYLFSKEHPRSESQGGLEAAGRRPKYKHHREQTILPLYTRQAMHASRFYTRLVSAAR